MVEGGIIEKTQGEVSKVRGELRKVFWNPAEANFLDGKGQFCQMLLKN